MSNNVNITIDDQGKVKVQRTLKLGPGQMFFGKDAENLTGAGCVTDIELFYEPEEEELFP